MTETTLYVVFQVSTGGIETEIVKVSGKINHWSVMKAIKEVIPYPRRMESIKIISWQIEDEFTWEEKQEFWKNY